MTASQQAVAAKLVEMGVRPAEADMLVRDPETAPHLSAERRLRGAAAVTEPRPKRVPAIPAHLMAEVLADGPHGYVRDLVKQHGLNMGTVLYYRHQHRRRTGTTKKALAVAARKVLP